MTTPNYYRPGDPLDKIVPFLCPTCGGINDARQYALLRLASGVCFFAPYKKCDCPSEPESALKHDGKLDAYGYVKIDEYPSVEIASRGDEETTLSYYETVHLTPTQALSLLAWLQQERETLERLVKEQDRAE